MHFIARNEFQPLDIARAQFQIAIRGIRRFHNQHRRLHLQRLEPRFGIVWSSVPSRPNAFTIVSLPSANFAASAERNAPSNFLRGKA